MTKLKEGTLESIEARQLIFGSLLMVANKMQVVADKSGDEVSLKQWLLMISILQFQEAPTLTEVAEFMGSSRQNVKQLALKLQAKGFVTIEPDQKDGRALKLLIRPECMAYFDKKLDYQEHFMELFYEGISQSELEGMAATMIKLMTNIEAMGKLIEGGNSI